MIAIMSAGYGKSHVVFAFLQDPDLQTASLGELVDQAEGNEAHDRTCCDLTLQLNDNSDDVDVSRSRPQSPNLPI